MGLLRSIFFDVAREKTVNLSLSKSHGKRGNRFYCTDVILPGHKRSPLFHASSRVRIDLFFPSPLRSFYYPTAGAKLPSIRGQDGAGREVSGSTANGSRDGTDPCMEPNTLKKRAFQKYRIFSFQTECKKVLKALFNSSHSRLS